MSNFPSFNTFSLSRDQEDLLMAALASNQQQSTVLALTPPIKETFNFSNGSLEAPIFGESPQNALIDTDFATMTDQQFMDFLDTGNGDDDFNPEDSPDYEMENSTKDLHDKRKSMIEDDKDDENSPKRREGEEKQAKKPGRKPLTSEPTSKRKAQNRAAQRAFRERKERHLKDLETKVSELEKISESQNHENSLLRAQVERQQTELREYKKRLSLQSTASSFSSFTMPTSTENSIVPNSFNFNFPQFSSLSYLPIDTSGQHPLFDMNMTTSPTIASRHGSADLLPTMANIAPSPDTPEPFKPFQGSLSSGSPPEIWPRKDFNIFSSPKANTIPAPSPRQDPDNHRGIFQFNTDSSSSPSMSSMSQGNGASSSCDTSPESTAHATTSIKDDQTPPEKANSTTNEEWQQNSNGQDFGSFSSANLLPTGAENAPLWVDLPANSVMGDGSFTGGFFNDIMPSGGIDYTPMDWSDLITGSSVKTGLTPAVQKSNPMEEITIMPPIKENEVSSHTSKGAIPPCNKIWESIKSRAELKNATDADIENLCTELRKKAKCSESGPVIDQKDIDAALERRLSSMSAHGSNAAAST